MGQIFAIALGGASGAILRFLVSTGIYSWLGRGFPYGTLTVNIIGSLLIGLLTEALILQRLVISLEFRSAILIGFLGSFTTFSTFSLDTLYLIEQGNLTKAILNVLISLCACIFAVWIGLLAGRTLFLYSGGMVKWMGYSFPYALVVINALLALLIGLIMTVLIHKISLSVEDSVVIMVVVVGVFATLSSLYLILSLIERGISFKVNANLMLAVLSVNTCVNCFAVWLGLLIGRQI